MPQQMYLFKVEYFQKKSEIVCYFKNEFSQRAFKFPFKPYFIVQKNIDSQKINDLLLLFKIKNFFIKEIDNKNFIFSNSFENLKKINLLIARFFNKKFLLLEPERIFLIEKEWSYFDYFCFEKDFPKKIFLEKDFFFILMPNISFKEAFYLNKDKVIFLIEKSIFSNILKIPLEKIPDTIQEKTEYFLENIYFKNGGFISWENKENFFSKKEFVPFGVFKNFSKIDFSNVWLQLFSNNFFNLGQDSINCDCCKPIKIDDYNLLPSTLIEVNPIEDNIFFISSSPTFSIDFNKFNPNKENRFVKKKEFFLKDFPIGPLFKDNKYALPLEDAKILLNDKKVFLSKKHSLVWHCLKKESFFSIEIKKIIEQLSFFKKIKDCDENKIIVEEKFSCFFNSIFFNCFNSICFEIPFQLTNPFSKFFLLSLAKTIISIQENILFKFFNFSEKNGFRVIFSDKRNVFVRGGSSLFLTKNFSKELNIPQPMILNFSKKASFR